MLGFLAWLAGHGHGGSRRTFRTVLAADCLEVVLDADHPAVAKIFYDCGWVMPSLRARRPTPKAERFPSF